MINITKGQMLSLIDKVLGWQYQVKISPENLPSRAVLFANAFEDPKPGRTDRMLLSGYTVLIEKYVDSGEFLSPESLLDVEMLMPRKALLQFFRSLASKTEWDKAAVQEFLIWLEKRLTNGTYSLDHCTLF